MSAPETTAPAVPLGYSEVFELLDAISQAKVDLLGTVAVAMEIIRANADEAVAATLLRHMDADATALSEAYAAAHDAILPPLHALQFNAGGAI